jgi:hypothetical protein
LFDLSLICYVSIDLIQLAIFLCFKMSCAVVMIGFAAVTNVRVRFEQFNKTRLSLGVNVLTCYNCEKRRQRMQARAAYLYNSGLIGGGR